MPTLEKDAEKGISPPLALIQAVINTRYGRTRPDDWKSSEQLRSWLIDHQLLARDVPVTQGDWQRMIEVREVIRALLRANNGIPVASSLIETLNHSAKHAPLIVHFRPDGLADLTSGIEGVDGVIGLLYGTVFTAMTAGTWARLKVCHNDRCQKAFYDSSKNRSGTWCSMAKCGSRVKARAYRKRQHEQAAEEK